MPEPEPPMPSAPDLESLKTYFAQTLGWGRGVQQDIVFGFLCDAADACRNGVVLDAGAGHQRYKPFFAGSHYIAQEHPVAGVSNKGICDYDILCDVKRIPLLDDSVDCVLSTSSLEHIEFPEQFFAEALRVLRPGGTLFINVPFVYPEHETPYDFQRPTRYGLQRWYEAAGFDRIQVRPASSSIYATTCFLKSAIFEGHRNPAALRTGLLGRLRALLDLRLLGKAAMYLLLVKPVIALLNLTLDRPPTDATVLPIGWVAVGRKPGEAGARARHATKLAFLQQRMLADHGFVLADGAIREAG